MNSLRLDTYNDELFNNLKTSFKTHLNINDLQSYFPIISLFTHIDNDNTQIIFDSIFSLINIDNKIEKDMDDCYIKYFFEADILNKSNENIEKKNIFKLDFIFQISDYLYLQMELMK